MRSPPVGSFLITSSVSFSTARMTWSTWIEWAR